MCFNWGANKLEDFFNIPLSLLPRRHRPIRHVEAESFLVGEVASDRPLHLLVIDTFIDQQ